MLVIALPAVTRPFYFLPLLRWLAPGAVLLVGSYFAWQRWGWARVALLAALLLVVLNLVVQISLARPAPTELLRATPGYVALAALVACLALVADRVAGNAWRPLPAHVALWAAGLGLIALGFLRVTRLILTTRHSRWDELNLWLLPVDILFVVAGLGLLSRNRLAQKLAALPVLPVMLWVLYRLARLLPFAIKGPFLLLMEGGAGVVHLNVLSVLTVALGCITILIIRPLGALHKSSFLQIELEHDCGWPE